MRPKNDTEQKNFELILNFNPLQPGVAFLYPLKTSQNM